MFRGSQVTVKKYFLTVLSNTLNNSVKKHCFNGTSEDFEHTVRRRLKDLWKINKLLLLKTNKNKKYI